MNPSYHSEYQEILKGVKEHLCEQHRKGSHVLAEKQNWEALRRMIASAPRAQPQVKPVAQQSIVPPPPPLSTTLNSVVKPTFVKQTELEPAPKKIIEEKFTRSLTLAEQSPPPTFDSTPWKETFRDKFPHVQLIDPTPKSTTESFGISIIYDTATPKEIAFLQNVARTTTTLLGPTRVLHVNQLDQKRRSLVVSYKAGVDNDLSIDDFSVYLQSPGVKAQLWRTLSNLYLQKSS